MMNVKDLDAIEQEHAARNEALVRALVEKGVDLGVPRLIEHHFWAETHRDGVRLANELYRQGFLLLVIARVKTDDDARQLWNVEAEFSQSVNEATRRETVAHLIRIAADRNCLYDGWGTRIGK